MRAWPILSSNLSTFSLPTTLRLSMKGMNHEIEICIFFFLLLEPPPSFLFLEGKRKQGEEKIVLCSNVFYWFSFLRPRRRRSGWREYQRWRWRRERWVISWFPQLPPLTELRRYSNRSLDSPKWITSILEGQAETGDRDTQSFPVLSLPYPPSARS